MNIKLIKESLDFFYKLACKEYQLAIVAINTNQLNNILIHQKNHSICINKFNRESAKYINLIKLMN